MKKRWRRMKFVVGRIDRKIDFYMSEAGGGHEKPEAVRLALAYFDRWIEGNRAKRGTLAGMEKCLRVVALGDNIEEPGHERVQPMEE